MTGGQNAQTYRKKEMLHGSKGINHALASDQASPGSNRHRQFPMKSPPPQQPRTNVSQVSPRLDLPTKTSLPLIAHDNHNGSNSSSIEPLNFAKQKLGSQHLITARSDPGNLRKFSKEMRRKTLANILEPQSSSSTKLLMLNSKSPKTRELTKLNWNSSGVFDQIEEDDDEETHAEGLEVWPANVDRDGSSNGATSLRAAKPKVLQELERFLEQSLIRHRLNADSIDTGDSFDIAQTQPYRECFRLFVDHFKTYKPLLTKIRNAYERAIEFAQEKVHDAEYLQNQTHVLEEEFKRKTDSKILQYAQENHELKKHVAILEEKVKEYETVQKPFEEELDQKERRIRLLEDEVDALQYSNRSLKDALKKLDGDKSSWEIDLETLSQLEREQRLTKKLEEQVKSLEEQLKSTKEELAKYESAESSPLVVELRAKLAKRNTDYFKIKAQFSLLSGRLGRIEKEKLKAMKEIERLKHRLEPFMEEGGNLTPRPLWDQLVQVYPKILGPLRDETTQLSSSKVIEEFVKLKQDYDSVTKELEEARNFIGLASRDTRMEEIQESQGKEKKWFIGIGWAKDVPKFLQYSGKILNRKFSKGFTEEMINEFWDAKDEQEQELQKKNEGSGVTKNSSKRKLTAKDFYYDFLMAKVMNEIDEEGGPPDEIDMEKIRHRKMAEWSYSMMDSLKKALYDPDCEMFYKIVYEGMSEDVFYEQNAMIDSVKEMLQNMKEEELANLSDDDEEDQPCSKTELLKSEILKGLRQLFPLKTEENFRRLIVCLNKDFPGLYVDFIQLFEEDEDYNQREFVEEIRHQFVVEREELIEELEESVIEHDANNDGSVTLNEIHMAILNVDPLRPIAEVDNLIAQGLNVTIVDLNPIMSLQGKRVYKGRLSTPVAKFAERIRQLYIRRFTSLRERAEILAQMEREKEEEERKKVESSLGMSEKSDSTDT